MSSVVPEGWSEEHLGSIFEKISNGTTANQIETENGESVTRIETISDGYINFDKVGKINTSDADKRYLMEQGDILFSNINSVKHIGKVAYFNGGKPLFHGMNLLLFRTNETYAHSKFMFNLMRSDDFRLEISKRVKPAINQASISGGDLKEINFLSPPLPEQKKIASILTSVDDVIEKIQAQINKLQDLKKGTMNELLTRGIGHTEFKESDLGMIPVDWEALLLDTVTIRGSGHTPNKGVPNYWNGGIKWVSLADSSRLDKGFIYSTDKEISREGVKNSSAVVHPKGTVVLSRDAGVGKSAVLKHDMAVSQHFMAWRCDDRMDSWYLYYLLQNWKQKFEAVAIGSTIKTIGLGYFKKLVIPYPTIEEQQHIASILTAIDTQIEAKQAKLHQTQALKKALMQDLLTGKKRVAA